MNHTSFCPGLDLSLHTVLPEDTAEDTAHSILSCSKQVIKNSPVKTFASATFSSLLDVFLSTTVFLILSITCFLKYGATATPPPPAALAVFGADLLLEVLSLIVSIRYAPLEKWLHCLASSSLFWLHG